MPQDAEQANHVPERSLAAFTKAHFWEPLKKLEVSQENERLQKLEVERQQQLLRRKDPFHFVRRPSDQNASRFSSFKDLDNHIQMRWDEYNEAQRKLSEVNPTSFEEAAALGHNCAKCWLEMVIRDHAASVIQAFWRRKTGRPLPNSGNSNRLGKQMFRKSTSVKEARLLGSKPKASEQTGTRKRDMRRSATETLDGRPSPPSPTLQHQGLIDRHTQRKALLDDRSSRESPQLATSDRSTPPSPQGSKRDAPADHRASVDHRAEGKKGASGQGMPFAHQMGRREDAETLAPDSPKKASKAAHPSAELRSSVLQQMSRSMHLDKASLLKDGEPPMSGPSSISEDAPSLSPAIPLAAQQRAPRTSGSRLEDLLFSSGLCTSQQQQLQHQGHSRSSDSTKVENLLLDGRPTYTRLSCDQGWRSRRSSLMAAHTSASGPLTFVSGSNSNNNSSSIGPSNPHNSRSSILDHNHLPQMEPGSSSSSSRPRRHSLTTNLVLSKSSCLPARTSTASGRLSTPAGAIMGRSASFTSNLQPQPPSGGHGNSAGREAPLLNTRGSGGLKPTGTRPSADGVMPSRLGLLSSTLHGSS